MPVFGIDDQVAVARHRAHEMMELALDRGHIGEDVGMIEFEIVENRDLRVVMDELRALIEEGGVVLVGLNDKVRARAEPCRHAEVLGHTTDEEAGRAPAGFEDPGEHRRRRSLAVRAGDGEDAALA
jgi:hypothetical protein